MTIEANILQVLKAETDARVIDVLRCQLDPVVYDVSELISALLAQSAIDPNPRSNKSFPNG